MLGSLGSIKTPYEPSRFSFARGSGGVTIEDFTWIVVRLIERQLLWYSTCNMGRGQWGSIFKSMVVLLLFP